MTTLQHGHSFSFNRLEMGWSMKYRELGGEGDLYSRCRFILVVHTDGEGAGRII